MSESKKKYLNSADNGNKSKPVLANQFIVNSLRYLLKHEDYIELNINQKINSKTSSFNYDRQTVC